MGFCYCCLFCILRRHPINNQRFPIEQLRSIVAATQKKSTVADVINQIEKDKGSRRASQLQIRLPEVSAV
jgi:hypothetical protein